MKKLKSFFSLILLIIALGIFFAYVSLEAERSHLANCAQLNVECEEGTMHKSVSALREWFKEKTGYSLPLPAFIDESHRQH